MMRSLIIASLVFGIAGPLCSKEVVVDKIVGVVNEDAITMSDLNDFEKEYRNKKVKIPPAEFEKVTSSNKNILNKMISDKLIYQYLKDNDLLSSKDEIDEMVKRRAASIGMSSADLARQLKMTGQTIDQFRAEMQIEQGKAKIFERELKTKITVLDSECEALFKKEFKQDVDVVEYKTQHILVKTKTVADEIQKKIKNGIPFSSLASTYQAVDLGFVKSGDMIPELFAVIKNMSPGDVKGPIQSKLGYSVFKLDELRSGKNQGYLKNKDQLERMLIDNQFQRQLSVWLDEKREDSYVRVYI